MAELSGRTALVTGASRGIGQEISRRLAADGAHVIVHYSTYRDGALATVEDITKAGGTASLVRAEFGAAGAVDELLGAVDDELGEGRLDIIVNNAAWFGGTVDDLTAESFELCCTVNIATPLMLVLGARERLNDGGRVINLSSCVTRMNVPEIAYAVSKGAVDVMTRSLAPVLGARGITVNAVSPGVTDTRWNAWVHTDPERAAGLAAMTALGRVGRPADIAAVVAFLASDDAGWITGQVIDVSGGIHL